MEIKSNYSTATAPSEAQAAGEGDRCLTTLNQCTHSHTAACFGQIQTPSRRNNSDKSQPPHMICIFLDSVRLTLPEPVTMSDVHRD